MSTVALLLCEFGEMKPTSPAGNYVTAPYSIWES